LGKKFKGSAILSVGLATDQVASFVRNIILARLLSKEEFGIGASFLIIITLVEMVSNFAADRILVQDPDGDEETFQGTAHLLRFIRGCLGGIMILLLAPFLAFLFDAPDSAASYRNLALVPFLNGLVHLDIERLQRKLRFGPLSSTWILSTTLSLALAYPISLYFRDHRATLWLLILRTALFAAVSHLTAERKFRWSFDKITAIKYFHFGWPLTVNALLFFFSFQGEKLIVGSGKTLFGNPELSMESLAVFSIAFSLCFQPTRFLSSLQGYLQFPILSRHQDRPEDFREKARLFAYISLFLGSLTLVPLVLLGGIVASALYGRAYLEVESILPMMAVALVVRFLRNCSTGASIALGKTKDPMHTNIVRALFLIPIILLAVFQGNLVHFAETMVVAESFAFYLSIRLLNRHGMIDPRPFYLNLFIILLLAALLFAIRILLFDSLDLVEKCGFTALLLGFLLLIGLRTQDGKVLIRMVRKI